MLPEENTDLNPLPLPLPRPLPLPPREGEFYFLSFISITRTDFDRDVHTNCHLNVVGKYHTIIINTPSHGASQVGSAAGAMASCND